MLGQQSFSKDSYRLEISTQLSPFFLPSFLFYISSLYHFFIFFATVIDTQQQQQVEVTKASVYVFLESIIDLGT